jgi:iron complex outermembrane receptor protein
VQGDLMDSTATNVFAKAGWTLDEERRVQLMANRYELEGDGDYTGVAGDIANGIPATSIRQSPALAPPSNLSTSVSLDYTDKSLGGGYFQAHL